MLTPKVKKENLTEKHELNNARGKNMKNIVEIINSLSNLLPRKPATSIQITDAELQLGISFAKEYKEYLAAFGAIMADGIELTGITKSEHRNVVAQTKSEWKCNTKIPHNMYVVENARVDGIIIWQDVNGLIYQSSSSSDAKQIARSLAEYISDRTKQ